MSDEFDFNPTNFLTGCFAAVVVAVALMFAVVIGNNNADNKRVKVHEAEVEGCTTIDSDEAVVACILALDEG